MGGCRRAAKVKPWLVLLLAGAGWASPAPPDTLWVEAAPERGFWILSWPSVEGADGYRIYREIAISMVIGTDETLEILPEPRYALVPWGRVVDQTDGLITDGIIQVVVATLDGDFSKFGVTTFIMEDGERVESRITTAYPPVSPDFNNDGRVDLADFFLFADAFGKRTPRFDLDGSGQVGLKDYALFADAFQGSTTGKENADK